MHEGLRILETGTRDRKSDPSTNSGTARSRRPAFTTRHAALRDAIQPHHLESPFKERVQHDPPRGQLIPRPGSPVEYSLHGVSLMQDLESHVEEIHRHRAALVIEREAVSERPRV